ncbi:non-hydrolyzing UDP-N-acetylglucosamine 2-epimerase [Mobiluncus porci]|uniref:UDP-N-acetylglucosamine 2-epimerase (non-hydrolyzing) n=1 Tax=Mobiluncus porci TaxID=2652278 RepID=A0A7K0K3N9_9ACTO|nr:UDP-N-acetylglucosamine 2-epimerase (non-hydrolyzing) [Mobiluncus porci]MST50044.1 UDP-N-acetylglucosamine 2-epimerase (non-hydrolyzing) [Mobiluncus porci]
MVSEPTVLVIYGTRPEAIKVAPVILAARDSKVAVKTLTTGQHPEMVAAVNEVFGIIPDASIDVMRPGQSLNALAARVLEGLDEKLAELKPDAIMVEGDTTTVMAAALAAFNSHIPVVHLEAGLRSGNLFLPFPEEANRRLAGQVASLHLAPTPASRANLLRENVDPKLIAVTGNTVIDALHYVVDSGQAGQGLAPEFAAALARDGLKVLVTAHRRESWGQPLHEMARAVRASADAHPEVTFLLPAHANPQVRETLTEVLAGAANVTIGDPQDYAAFAGLIKGVDLVLTDSGGIQEEAPALGKPVLVMRDTTERPEAIAAGTARLVGTTYESVHSALEGMLISQEARAVMSRAVNPYGDGHAAERVVAALEELLGVGKRLPDFAA